MEKIKTPVVFHELCANTYISTGHSPMLNRINQNITQQEMGKPK